MRHAMIDIETLGGGNDGLVVSIGAVAFRPLAGGPQWEEPLLVNIRIQSALDHGAVVEGDTIRWWLERDKAARRGLFKPTPVEESAALEQLRQWYQRLQLTGAWSHGSNFDLRLLRAAYARYGQRCPWHWKAEYDTRTLFAVVEYTGRGQPTWPENPAKHNALQDAIVQAAVVQDAFRLLGGIIPLDKPAKTVVESALPVEDSCDGTSHSA